MNPGSLPSYFDHNFEHCPRRVSAVIRKLIFSLTFYKGREHLSLLNFLAFLHTARREYVEADLTLSKCKFLNSTNILTFTTEIELHKRRGHYKKSKSTSKQMQGVFQEGYSPQRQAETLVDLSFAHIVFGLNCAALDLLHKAKSILTSKSHSRVNCFLRFCYGLVYYYYSQNCERGLTQYYAGLCLDHLTPLSKFSEYKSVCGVYLWKLRARTGGSTGPVPTGLVSSAYAQYQVGKECVKATMPGKGMNLLQKSLTGCKLPDAYFWIAEAIVKITNRGLGYDAVWRDILAKCPRYVKAPANEQESGVSPPPPTAISIYRKRRHRKLALTSPSDLMKLMENIEGRECGEEERGFKRASSLYMKAISTSPVVVDKYFLALARMLIYLNDVLGAEAILTRLLQQATSAFVLFDTSLLLASCFANGKIQVAAEHIVRCLDLLPKIVVSPDQIKVLTQWSVYYANYHSYRRNSIDFKYWVQHLVYLGYPKTQPLLQRLQQLQDEKIMRIVGQKWANKNRVPAIGGGPRINRSSTGRVSSTARVSFSTLEMEMDDGT